MLIIFWVNIQQINDVVILWMTFQDIISPSTNGLIYSFMRIGIIIQCRTSWVIINTLYLEIRLISFPHSVPFYILSRQKVVRCNITNMIMVPFFIPFFSLSLSSLYDFSMLMREFAHEGIMAQGGLKIHPTTYLVLLLTKNIGFTSLKSRHTFSNTILYIRYMLSWKSVAFVCREHVCLLPTRCSKNCCTAILLKKRNG